MTLINAATNALIELNNQHREYLAGRHGGCPCLTSPQHETCPLQSAIAELDEALIEEGHPAGIVLATTVNTMTIED